MRHIRGLIGELYPQNVDQIVMELEDYASKLNKIEINFVNEFWYKHLNLYVVYPDTFPAPKGELFKTLTEKLDYIKNLGFDAIHVLPFLKSPMIDKGFDVSDYFEVREELGTLDDLMRFKFEAEKRGMRLFMDMALNHTSMEHQWARSAESGDEYYREFYFTRTSKPDYLKTVHRDAAVWAVYKEGDEQIEANIAFPEQAGDVPHWREGKDGYWYYHTYYPQQPDLNWFNPEVFIEFARIVMFWASHGFNFRFDAIPFVGKAPYKDARNYDPNTHRILNALFLVAREIYPECAILIESYEKLESIISYYGDSNNRQSQLAYNFFLTTDLWTGLVKEDVTHVWEKLAQMKNIPSHGTWMNFLRNHDELSLAHMGEDLREEVVDDLKAKGESFRDVYGIAGRTYSLLGNNIKRFKMAYMLAASFPGGLSVIYGDEIGKQNEDKDDLSKHERKDSRNINRGVIREEDLDEERAEHLYHTISGIINTRKILKDYINIWPSRVNISDDNSLFAARYKLGRSELVILINLSEIPKALDFDPEPYKSLLQINRVQLDDGTVELGGYAGVWLQI